MKYTKCAYVLMEHIKRMMEVVQHALLKWYLLMIFVNAFSTSMIQAMEYVSHAKAKMMVPNAKEMCIETIIDKFMNLLIKIRFYQTHNFMYLLILFYN